MDIPLCGVQTPMADSAEPEGTREEMYASATTLRVKPRQRRRLGNRGAASSKGAARKQILAGEMETGERDELPVQTR